MNMNGLESFWNFRRPEGGWKPFLQFFFHMMVHKYAIVKYSTIRIVVYRNPENKTTSHRIGSD